MKVFITGRPGCGKTTLILKLLEYFREKGVRVGGFVTREIREGRKRIGFEVEDIQGGTRGVLAHMNLRTSVKVSKYFVNVEEFERVGIRAIQKSLEEEKDLIVIDEIGKMELASSKFSKLLEDVLSSEVNLLATLHLALVGKFNQSGKVFYLNRKNFEKIFEEICKLF
ncbi:MAG: NTPase [Candidatus Nanoarchaeia archaeon]|nr:NTPase [Candidatus Haiyanarchaeum thermophilum]MCW1303232.1 NTPase [Candidatus Haiyanarchaeum thermophilum]MCW1304037.1 NTPase [Candidatus Haiyanarchaeum thermophilum]MCW1306776.1 NTPase [Candidatus Haiyanarchaeum thermophilum]MCW1307479.1 NTPase [Candidatus Haiyanarchaeum thermophilum]